MLLVYDNPTIQYVVEEAVSSGIDDILIITGRGKRFIEDHFDKSAELKVTLENADKLDCLRQVMDIGGLADICYVGQKIKMAWGDAISCAEKHIGDEAFAVLLGDSITRGPVPCTRQLMDVYEKYGSSVISLEAVPRDKIECYGIINGTEVGPNVYEINQLVEKPPANEAPSNLAIMGRYVLTSDIFDKLKETEAGVGGEIQLTDAYQN